MPKIAYGDNTREILYGNNTREEIVYGDNTRVFEAYGILHARAIQNLGRQVTRSNFGPIDLTRL